MNQEFHAKTRRTIKLFVFELTLAYKSALQVTPEDSPVFFHIFWHQYLPVLRGYPLDYLIRDIDEVLLPAIMTRVAEPEFLVYAKQVSKILDVLRHMNSTPQYWCDRC